MWRQACDQLKGRNRVLNDEQVKEMLQNQPYTVKKLERDFGNPVFDIQMPTLKSDAFSSPVNVMIGDSDIKIRSGSDEVMHIPLKMDENPRVFVREVDPSEVLRSEERSSYSYSTKDFGPSDNVIPKITHTFVSQNNFRLADSFTEKMNSAMNPSVFFDAPQRGSQQQKRGSFQTDFKVTPTYVAGGPMYASMHDVSEPLERREHIIPVMQETSNKFQSVAKMNMNPEKPKPFSNLPMHIAPVHNAPVHNAPVHNAPVHNAPLHNAPLHNAPLHNAPLHNAPLHNAPFHNAPVHNAPLHNAPVHNAPLHNAPLHNAPLHNAPVHNAPLHNAPLHNAPVHNAPFHKETEGFLIKQNDKPVKKSQLDSVEFPSTKMFSDYLPQSSIPPQPLFAKDWQQTSTKPPQEESTSYPFMNFSGEFQKKVSVEENDKPEYQQPAHSAPLQRPTSHNTGYEENPYKVFMPPEPSATPSHVPKAPPSPNFSNKGLGLELLCFFSFEFC